jgi:hypothetical protein
MFLSSLFSFSVEEMLLIRARDLTDRKIVTSDAYLLGELEGITIDTENWLVSYLRVALSRHAIEDLHLEAPILLDIVISLPVRFIKKFGDAIELNATFSEIAAITKSK